MSDATHHPERAEDALEIARLAALDALDYDRERIAAAERMGNIRVSVLDELVKRAKPQTDTTHGRVIGLREVTPWAAPVVLGEVLDDITLDLLRESGEVPMMQEDPHEAAATVYEGI